MSWWEIALIYFGCTIGAIIVYIVIAFALANTELLYPEYPLAGFWPIALPLLCVLFVIHKIKAIKLRMRSIRADKKYLELNDSSLERVNSEQIK